MPLQFAEPVPVFVHMTSEWPIGSAVMPRLCELAVEVLVAGAVATEAAVDVDMPDLELRDTDRPWAGEHPGGTDGCGDRQ